MERNITPGNEQMVLMANNICIFIVMSALIFLLNCPPKGNLLLSKLEQSIFD
jgi:hypothetical protein